MSDMQKNVTPGRRKGCPNYPPEFKQQLVAASCEPGIQLWHKGQCVAQHPRSTHEYKHTTNPLHMPERHRQHGTWTPERLIEQGKRTGPSTGRVVESMLKAKPHPELAYRAVLGKRPEKYVA